MIPFTLPTVAKFTHEMADYQAISTKNLAVEHKPLHVPPKEEIAKSKLPNELCLLCYLYNHLSMRK